jgi:GrpB-like predicted nucleotidyltransferase (UPF0157 family)
MADERVVLRPYQPGWAGEFRQEAAAIQELIGEWVTGGVHHVGSTAVPGMVAKPVIDIMAGVSGLDESRPCVELLEQLEYCYAPYRADVMHWFCKPSPQRRTHHLHLVPTGSQRFTDVLRFRDYLRTHPVVADQYARLKRQLAVRFVDDREAYTQGKSEMVAAVTADAHRWAAAGGVS